MVSIQISEPLAERLAKIANQEHRSLDEVVESILEAHAPENDSEEIATPVVPGSLAALIQAADEANLHSGYTDTAERSREILNSEYGDYLRDKYKLDKKPDNTP